MKGIRFPVWLCLIVTGLGGSQATAQPPTPFPPEVYAARRHTLVDRVDAPVIVPGRYLIRSSEKQDLNFWYLTGVESPYAVLVLIPGPNGMREVLFLPTEFQFAGAQYPMDDQRFRRAKWNRPHQRLAPGPAAQRRTGIAETYPVDELAQRLPDLIDAAPEVFTTMEREPLYAPPGLTPPRSLTQQFADAIRTLLPGVRLADATPHLAALRLIKDEHEIGALRRAADISARSMVEALHAIRPGLRDLAIAGVMEAFWKREGAPRTAFGPIVSSGPSSMLLYTLRAENYDFADRIMEDGDLLFIDYGAAEVQMYASDVCRTYPVSGQFTAEQRRYYEIVLEAQEAALAAIRPGVMMIDVIRAAAGVFLRHGLDAYEDIDRMGVDRVWGLMPSPTYWVKNRGELTRYSGARGIGVRDLGHHVGLDASDSRDYSQPLRAGMVFTVEPKVYIPDANIAIMIEDVILVSDDGYENLSAAAPKTVTEIERIMAERRP